MNCKYFVYIYCDSRKPFTCNKLDSLQYQPFYIGKGCGDRDKDTLKKVLRNKPIHNDFLANKIRSIWNKGSNVRVLLPYQNLSLKDSLVKEHGLIKIFGRCGIDDGGILTNRSSGFDFFNIKDIEDLSGDKYSTHFNYKTVEEGIQLKICEYYLKHKGLVSIGREFNMGAAKIKEILLSHNISIRTKSETRVGKLNPMYGKNRNAK